jgi:hypothetical protein
MAKQTGKTGTCQVCGRAQAIIVNRKGGEVIARHGFTLSGFGGSSRACAGSQWAAAETGRVDAIEFDAGLCARRLATAEEEGRSQSAGSFRKWIAFLETRRAEILAKHAAK